MGLVDDNCKTIILVLRADFRKCKRELLNGGDDDSLACCNSIGKIAGMLCPDHGVAHLHELLDGISDLLIENASVCDHNDRINKRTGTIQLQLYKLISKPCDRIGLTAASAVLNQVSLADTVFLNIRQNCLHHIQLMVTREYLLHTFLLGLRIGFLDYLCVVLDNTSQLFLGQYVFPKVIRHQPVGIWRIPSAVVVAFIERKEPAILTSQLRTELDASIIHGEMNHAALKRE